MQYNHLNDLPPAERMDPCSHYLVVLVCARHLDYTNGRQLLKTIARHPSDGSKNSDVGHAWVLLQGREGRLEGGHTGEFGVVQPRYFEGVADLIDEGDPNPVRYLWAAQKDGCFQKGSGGFVPTFAARIKLTPEQYRKARAFIFSYFYRDYAITRLNCATFAADVAKIAGVELKTSVTVSIEQTITLYGEKVQLWNDPSYAKLTISSPDILEKSLMQVVKEGKAQNATKWYLKHNPRKTTLADQIRSMKTIGSKLKRTFI